MAQWLTNFSLKDQVIHILGFAGQEINEDIVYVYKHTKRDHFIM